MRTKTEVEVYFLLIDSEVTQIDNIILLANQFSFIVVIYLRKKNPPWILKI